MSFIKHLAASAAALALSAGAALANPAVIFDMGGKFDKSFNESAYKGAEKWVEETGGKYFEIEISAEAQREQALRRFAERGANPIITTGFAMADPVAQVAPDYPDITFVNVDGFFPNLDELPNVLAISFAEHEGSYLVGMLAAQNSKSGTIGFIGGMDVPLIRHFGCGYAQGAVAVNPDIKVIPNMTGTTPAAWNDPVTGGELAKAQVGQGADVIYAAAGGTGVGVLQAAADEGIFSIGVDDNQNHLHPGSVLTSMLKRVDVAVYNALMAGESLETGQLSLSLADEGVGYAVDENNESLLSEEMLAKVEEAKAAIIAGDLEVTSYYANDSCPVLNF